MKTETRYLYVDNKTTKLNDKQGLIENHYTIIEVQTFNHNYDEAERKARTIVEKMGLKLAGGSFGEQSKPYNFETNYKVVNCPKNTKIQPYTKKDLYIINLIENGL
jgi:hypothetical protein